MKITANRDGHRTKCKKNSLLGSKSFTSENFSPDIASLTRRDTKNSHLSSKKIAFHLANFSKAYQKTGHYFKCINLPVLNTIKAFLIGNIVHEDESHGASVVGCGDGAVTLLPRGILEIDTFILIKAKRKSTFFGSF